MTLETATAEALKKQIDADEKILAGLKKALLAKKITVKVMEKQAERNKPELPSKLFNIIKLKLTSQFARMHKSAELALTEPNKCAAADLETEAENLLDKCVTISDRTHRKAGKFAVRAASMVMRLEAAVEQLLLGESMTIVLIGRAADLDAQVQRLRPVETKSNAVANVEDTINDLETKVLQEVAPC